MFELKTDSIWEVPEPGERTKVNFSLEITNTGREPVRFPIFDVDKITVTLRDEQDREFLWVGGQDGIVPGKSVSDLILPGDTFELILTSHLDWDADQRLQASFEDGLGSRWWIGPLAPGAYQVEMAYENWSGDVWQGRGNISAVNIEIK